MESYSTERLLRRIHLRDARMQGVMTRWGGGPELLAVSTWKVRTWPPVKSSALRDSVAGSGLMNVRLEGIVA